MGTLPIRSAALPSLKASATLSFSWKAASVSSVSKPLVERKLIENGDRLKRLRHDLQVAEEQLLSLADDADDARIRALVSETPLADREHRDADRHAKAMARARDDLRAEIEALETRQDDLLDELNS